jgi:hypothetical protein
MEVVQITVALIGIINFIIVHKFLLMCREECEDTVGAIS